MGQDALWADSPHWAQFLEQDSRGVWFWHEYLPKGNKDGRKLPVQGDCSRLIPGLYTRAPKPKRATITPKHSHYHKPTNGVQSVDVYWVLNNWGVECHAIGHAIKKLLNAGQRGHKDARQDLLEARDSIDRALELRGGNEI